MKHAQVLVTVLLITSVVLGDKLYLKNGQIFNGKYEGISEKNKVIFLINNNPVEFDIPNIEEITDDEGNIIMTQLEINKQLRTNYSKRSTLGVFLSFPYNDLWPRVSPFDSRLTGVFTQFSGYLTDNFAMTLTVNHVPYWAGGNYRSSFGFGVGVRAESIVYGGLSFMRQRVLQIYYDESGQDTKENLDFLFEVGVLLPIGKSINVDFGAKLLMGANYTGVMIPMFNVGITFVNWKFK